MPASAELRPQTLDGVKLFHIRDLVKTAQTALGLYTGEDKHGSGPAHGHAAHGHSAHGSVMHHKHSGRSPNHAATAAGGTSGLTGGTDPSNPATTATVRKLPSIRVRNEPVSLELQRERSTADAASEHPVARGTQSFGREQSIRFFGQKAGQMKHEVLSRRRDAAKMTRLQSLTLLDNSQRPMETVEEVMYTLEGTRLYRALSHKMKLELSRFVHWQAHKSGHVTYGLFMNKQIN